jgi:hypothetical protein
MSAKRKRPISEEVPVEKRRREERQITTNDTDRLVTVEHAACSV